VLGSATEGAHLIMPALTYPDSPGHKIAGQIGSRDFNAHSGMGRRSAAVADLEDILFAQ